MPRFRRRHRLARLLVATPLLVGTPPAGAAPASRTLVPGDRVRYVTASGGPEWTRGKLLKVEGSQWLVLPEEFRPEHPLPPSWIQSASLEKVEVLRKSGPWVKKGLLAGAAVGASLGASGRVIHCECREAGDRMVQAVLVGTMMGGIGALIAKVAKPEQWDPIVDGRVRVSVAPTRGPQEQGLGAAVSVSFR